MRVLCFGTYQRDYPRNAQVRSSLQRAGVDVVERHAAVWDDRRHNWSAGAAVVGRLAAAELELLRPPREHFDVVLVGYPGHADLVAARRAARGRPVVFDPLVSLSDTFVSDRRRFAPGSLPARLLRALDRRSLRAAELVVADTEANAEFLASLAALPRERVAVCLVGAEERLFRPGRRPEETFTCLFVGKLAPLHGVDTVLEAARLAADIRFRVIGSGQLDGLLDDRPRNLEWIPWRAYEELPGELARAGCALGIFGVSDKARRVIPNKAFQALATGTPLITADTPAARELLRDGKSALLVPPGDPVALADAVRALASDAALAQRLGEGGLAAYRERAAEAVLGRRWRALLEELL